MKSKAEAETVSRKLRELPDDELSQVSGGIILEPDAPDPGIDYSVREIDPLS